MRRLLPILLYAACAHGGPKEPAPTPPPATPSNAAVAPADPAPCSDVVHHAFNSGAAANGTPDKGMRVT